MDNKSLRVLELRAKLKVLGAKTSGNKRVLLERLENWTKHSLDPSLIKAAVVPSLTSVPFPPDDQFLPICQISTKCLSSFTLSSIHLWFEERSACASEERGLKLLFSKFLKCVEGVIICNTFFIKSMCAAEMSKHKDYFVKLVIGLEKENSEILQASCSCIGGNGCSWSAACKHVAALSHHIEIYKLTGKSEELISKTSCLQTWHRPPAGRMVVAKSVSEILGVKTSCIKPTEKCSASFLNAVINRGVDAAATDIRNANLQGYFSDHDYVLDLPKQALVLRNTVSEKEIKKIERLTRSQRKSKLWNRVRLSRITGSMIGSVERTVRSGNYSTGPAMRQVQPSKNLRCAALKWGIKNEAVAIENYQEITGDRVIPCGIVIDKERNYVAASPDGLCGELFNDKSVLVEVKCPYSVRNKKPTSAPYITSKNGRYSLNKSHVYYSQIQTEMHVTKAKLCDFVVWTTEGIYIEPIPYDEAYCRDMFKRVDFYFNKIFAPIYWSIYSK